MVDRMERMIEKTEYEFEILRSSTIASERQSSLLVYVGCSDTGKSSLIGALLREKIGDVNHNTDTAIDISREKCCSLPRLIPELSL